MCSNGSRLERGHQPTLKHDFMGYTPAHMIQIAASHLLSVLSKKPSVKFSHFYDGKTETSDLLAVALGLEEAKDWYCVEHIVDLAAHELSEQGVVEVIELTDILAEGTNDYEIFVTEKGREPHFSARTLTFLDAE